MASGPGPKWTGRLAHLSADVRSSSVVHRQARWILVPLAIALSSRLFSGGVILGLNTFAHLDPINALAAWDGAWYLEIAQHGYHALPLQVGPPPAQYDFAFFPAWPALVGVVSAGGLDPAFVAVVLANALFLVAAVLIWRVFADRSGPAVATAGLALLAFSPVAYVFSMTYSEPLFLVCAGLFFLTPRRPVSHGIAALLGMASRITGAALVAAALVSAARSRRVERRSALLAAAAGATVFAIWWVAIALLVGDPLGFLRGSPSWGQVTGVHGYVVDLLHPTPRTLAWLGFGALVVAGASLALLRDLELGVYALACLALCLLPGGLAHSVPRYAVVAFPAFGALAERLGRRWTLVLLALFMLGQVVFARWVFESPIGSAP